MARVRSVLARFGLRPHHHGDPDEREPAPPAPDPAAAPPLTTTDEYPAVQDDRVDEWSEDSFPASDPPPGP